MHDGRASLYIWCLYDGRASHIYNWGACMMVGLLIYIYTFGGCMMVGLLIYIYIYIW